MDRNQKVLGVRESPMPGIYEVFTGASVFHTNATASYIPATPRQALVKPRDTKAGS